MRSLLLAGPGQWFEYYKDLRRSGPQTDRWFRYLDARNRSIVEHFDRDYTGCIGSRELKSEFDYAAVSVFVFGDLHSLGDRDSLVGVVDVTLNVVLKNGETLSKSEALQGLGEFSPEHIERRKRDVQNGWLPTDKRGERLNYFREDSDGV